MITQSAKLGSAALCVDAIGYDAVIILFESMLGKNRIVSFSEKQDGFPSLTFALDFRPKDTGRSR